MLSLLSLRTTLYNKYVYIYIYIIIFTKVFQLLLQMVSLYKDPDGNEIFQPTGTKAINTVNISHNPSVENFDHVTSPKVNH